MKCFESVKVSFSGVVVRIRELADSIGATIEGRPSSDYYNREASRLLENIKAINLEPKDEKAKEALRQAESSKLPLFFWIVAQNLSLFLALNQSQTLASNRQKVKNDSVSARDRLANLTGKLNEHRTFLDQSRAKTGQAEDAGRRATAHPFYVSARSF